MVSLSQNGKNWFRFHNFINQIYARFETRAQISTKQNWRSFTYPDLPRLARIALEFPNKIKILLQIMIQVIHQIILPWSKLFLLKLPTKFPFFPAKTIRSVRQHIRPQSPTNVSVNNCISKTPYLENDFPLHFRFNPLELSENTQKSEKKLELG